MHTRFSTNTFPSWERAHPLRMLAHNGEINTLRGNVNLMKAREGVMSSSRFGKRVLTELYPVVEPNLSDSGSADCVLEFLVRAGGRSLPEVRPLIPSLINSKSVRNPHRNDVIFLKKYFYSGRILRTRLAYFPLETDCQHIDIPVDHPPAMRTGWFMFHSLLIGGYRCDWPTPAA